MNYDITIVGGGLAGCEAAWQIANRGIKVRLYEMRPAIQTPAHKTGKLAELVCSNSFRSNEIASAPGLLKEEMRQLNSLIIGTADKFQVPAGSALAVDRKKFSDEITRIISEHENIELVRKEITDIPKPPAIIATGPLTSKLLSKSIAEVLGSEHLYFYDAAAPIVTKDSINWDVAFWGSRYNKGSSDYINLPLTSEEYRKFYFELIRAETYPLREFDIPAFFEGCMPIEIMARRGPKTLLFGPLKPVGIVDPRTGKQPFAVVQLRREDLECRLFNMVGFQTSLRWKEQERVFRQIPGLENAEFIRYGFIHRNTFILSPKFLDPTLEMKQCKGLFFAGQITGVEGYIESAASGIVAGINAARFYNDKPLIVFPKETMIGALCNYITTANQSNFQPMKSNFGIIPPLKDKIKDKRNKKIKMSERSIDVLETFIDVYRLNLQNK